MYVYEEKRDNRMTPVIFTELFFIVQHLNIMKHFNTSIVIGFTLQFNKFQRIFYIKPQLI